MRRLLLALCIVSISHAQDSKRDFLVTGSEAYLLMPPDVVCGPTVTWMNWTPDGRYLMAKRQVLRVKAHRTTKTDPSAIFDLIQQVGEEVVVWDASTRQSKSIFSLRPGEGQIGQIDGLQNGYFLIGASRPVQSESSSIVTTPTLYIATPSGSKVLLRETGEFFSTSPSSRGDMFFVESAPGGPRTVRLFAYNGNPMRSMNLERNEHLMWLPSNELVMMRFSRGGTREGTHREAFLLNPVTGLTTPTQMPELGPTRAEGAFQLREFRAPVAHPKVQGTAGLLWLESRDQNASSAALVSADGYFGRLSPLSNEIAYLVQGAALVRPVVQVPLSLFEEARRAAERTEALSKAKQIGIAILMYAADSDDQAPGKADWQKKLEPYTKNKGLFDNFTYTFTGGDLSGIKNPAETELGYVSVDGGRAVVYADGHAKFIKD